MQDYKKLKVWQRSHELTILIYQLTKTYPKEELFGLTSQIRRSAISVPANLAEGCGRISKNDISHFFQIALGSLQETEYYLILSNDLKYIQIKEFKTYQN
jgi:four helix bundle protein